MSDPYISSHGFIRDVHSLFKKTYAYDATIYVHRGHQNMQYSICTITNILTIAQISFPIL